MGSGLEWLDVDRRLTLVDRGSGTIQRAKVEIVRICGIRLGSVFGEYLEFANESARFRGEVAP